MSKKRKYSKSFNSEPKQLPSGRWRVQLYLGKDDNGKRIMKSFTADKPWEAMQQAEEYMECRREKEEIGMTVGEAIDAYIDSKENILSPSTIGGYRVTRRNHLQKLMDVPLSRLDNRTVQAEINREALRLSPKTLRNAHGLLSAALGMFLPDLTLHTTLPAKQHKIKHLPDAVEVIRAVQGEEIELPVMLALWLSLRISEVRGLKFSDIQGNTLTIRSAIVTVDGEHIEKQQTKTHHSTRQLEIPPYIMQLINKARETAEDEYLVTMSGQALYKRFVRLLERKGVSPMTFHDLRHLNASVMVPDKYAMERGGWSSNRTLQNVYQHTFSEKSREVDAKIGTYFESLINPEGV